jgi:hypothetical protein
MIARIVVVLTTELARFGRPHHRQASSSPIVLAMPTGSSGMSTDDSKYTRGELAYLSLQRGSTVEGGDEHLNRTLAQHVDHLGSTPSEASARSRP